MKQPSTLQIILGLPRLLWNYATNPLKRALFNAAPTPDTQAELARLVERTFHHEIRAGYEHHFIRLMFVTVGDRIFCRQYQFGENSWRDVFLKDSRGQVRLDNTVANIDAKEPIDYEAIIPEVDRAYRRNLKKIGASFMISGALEPRAQSSTMEAFLSDAPTSKA